METRISASKLFVGSRFRDGWPEVKHGTLRSKDLAAEAAKLVERKETESDTVKNLRKIARASIMAARVQDLMIDQMKWMQDHHNKNMKWRPAVQKDFYTLLRTQMNLRQESAESACSSRSVSI